MASTVETAAAAGALCCPCAPTIRAKPRSPPDDCWAPKAPLVGAHLEPAGLDSSSDREWVIRKGRAAYRCKRLCLWAWRRGETRALADCWRPGEVDVQSI